MFILIQYHYDFGRCLSILFAQWCFRGSLGRFVAWTAPSRASQAALNRQLNKQHQQQLQGAG